MSVTADSGVISLESLSINDNNKPVNVPVQQPIQNKKPLPSHGISEDQIKKAATLLGSQIKDCTPTLTSDGMNSGTTIHLVSNKDSDFVIIMVNGIELTDYQLIHGVPKLTKLDNNNGKSISDLQFKRYYLSNKWNGMNIQVFKYKDSTGTSFISAKPRATPFVNNDSKGTTITWVQSVLKSNPSLIEELTMEDSKLESIVFELCGSKVPHIVKYDFQLDLKPLFTINKSGNITPIVNSHGELKSFDEQVDSNTLLQEMVELKKELLAKNKKFRADNNLKENMFWFNHFAEEGRVLYLLKDDNTLVQNKLIFSVKPFDTEKNHWEQFDNELQSKILLIVHECNEKGLPINSETLMKEMDLDEFSWVRHQHDIMDLAVLPPVLEQTSPIKKGNKKEPVPTTPSKKSKILITCGFPASGKSYFSQKLAESIDVSWKRINQDDLGTRKKCEDLFKQHLKSGDNIIVDRCNQDISQRRNWMKLARMGGVSDIHLLWFKIDQQICKDRIVVRENHPTIPKGQEGIQIIDKFQSMFTDPSTLEGFTSLSLIQSEADSNELIVKYTTPIIDENSQSIVDKNNTSSDTTASTSS